MDHIESPQSRPGNLYVLSCELPGCSEFGIGVLLEDPELDLLHVKLRNDWSLLVPEDYQEYLAALEDDFREKAEEMGAKVLLAQLLSQLSNFLRITDPEIVTVGDFPLALALLFEQRVHPKPRS